MMKAGESSFTRCKARLGRPQDAKKQQLHEALTGAVQAKVMAWHEQLAWGASRAAEIPSSPLCHLCTELCNVQVMS